MVSSLIKSVWVRWKVALYFLTSPYFRCFLFKNYDCVGILECHVKFQNIYSIQLKENLNELVNIIALDVLNKFLGMF